MSKKFNARARVRKLLMTRGIKQYVEQEKELESRRCELLEHPLVNMGQVHAAKTHIMKGIEDRLVCEMQTREGYAMYFYKKLLKARRDDLGFIDYDSLVELAVTTSHWVWLELYASHAGATS